MIDRVIEDIKGLSVGGRLRVPEPIRGRMGTLVCRWADGWWLLWEDCEVEDGRVTLGLDFDAFWKMEQYLRTGGGGRPIRGEVGRRPRKQKGQKGTEHGKQD